jgi:hypothetical protein
MMAILNNAGQVGYNMSTAVAYNYEPKSEAKIYSDRESWEYIFIGGNPIFEKDTQIFSNMDSKGVM